jgi:hypothetical protein
MFHRVPTVLLIAAWLHGVVVEPLPEEAPSTDIADSHTGSAIALVPVQAFSSRV